MTSFDLRPLGPFSLSAAARFASGFPGFDAQDDGTLRFAWTLDGAPVGVALRQTPSGRVRGEAVGEGDVRGAVAEILSLDVDATQFAAIGERDRVAGELIARTDALRPVLFYSPYEAAAWAILGQRIRMPQARAARRALAEDHGERVDVDGQELVAFPAPQALAALPGVPRGLNERKADQLRALGRAAADGELDRARLRALEPDAALEDLQRLKGIGPFGAELVLLRGVGVPDRAPVHETRLHAAVRAAYGLGDDAPIEPVVEGWRPFRAWMTLILRATS